MLFPQTGECITQCVTSFPTCRGGGSGVVVVVVVVVTRPLPFLTHMSLVSRLCGGSGSGGRRTVVVV